MRCWQAGRSEKEEEQSNALERGKSESAIGLNGVYQEEANYIGLKANNHMLGFFRCL